MHTRFSIADHEFKGFVVTRTLQKNEYLAELYSEKRLAVKFAAFETFTLPSVLNQKWKDWEWHIYTSSSVAPAHFTERLNSLVSMDARIHVHDVSSMADCFALSKKLDAAAPCVVASMRLDDDDALHQSIFQRMQQFADEPRGTVVGLLGGLLSMLKDGVPHASTYTYGSHPHVIALGMTRIGDNVFSAGNHSICHERHPCRYISAEKGMVPFLCFSDEQYTDTSRKSNVEFMKPIDVKRFLGGC